VSNLSEAVSALRQVLNITEDVKAAGEKLEQLAEEIRVLDRRITRLEAQWETIWRVARRPELPEE
jgi:cell division protein FtsB